MNSEKYLSELYNQIGVEVVRAVGEPDTKALIYTEMDDGVQQTIVRYFDPKTMSVKSDIETRSIVDLVRKAWQWTSQQPDQKIWTDMIYLMDNGQVNVELRYEGGPDLDRPIWEREDEIVSKYFPELR